MVEETYTLSSAAARSYESTFVPALFRPWAERLVEAADVGPEVTVLDVACGTGIVARVAAARGAKAVTGVDLNEAMLEVARELAPSLSWRVADAGALPFPDASFDRVLCQGALMFFPDRLAALAEMGRVVRPDGRVVLQVPGRLTHSPGYLALSTVVGRHAGPAASELLGAYFAVGSPDLLTESVRAAGLRLDRLDTWLGATRLASLESFLEVELLPIADSVDAEVRERIVEDARVELAEFLEPGGGVAAPIEVQLVVASRA